MKLLRIVLATALTATTVAAQQDRQPQNVQVLKGLSHERLVRTMRFVAASLGVNCQFCHVFKPNNERDFASDAKEEKRTAREMMRLVIDTNTKYFKNRPEVTCNTCHRGTTHPAGTPVLPVSEPQPRPAPQPEMAMPARDEIVSRYAKALGNIDEKALSTMELKGVRETSRGNLPIDVLIAPGQARVTATAPDGEIVNAINGTSGWARDGRGRVHAMSPGEVDAAAQVLDAFRLTLPSEIPAEAKVGKAKIDDKDVWVLTTSFEGDGRQRLYFDAQSGLLVRRLRFSPSPIGNVPQQTDFADYRDVAGMKLPFVVRVDTIDPRAGSTRRYSEIRLNATIDQTLFRQPES